jgi:hypothetical protein
MQVVNEPALILTENFSVKDRSKTGDSHAVSWIFMSFIPFRSLLEVLSKAEETPRWHILREDHRKHVGANVFLLPLMFGWYVRQDSSPMHHVRVSF